jgi:hypothetical protein
MQWGGNTLVRLGSLYFAMMGLAMMIAMPEVGLGLTALFWGLDAWREYRAARPR